jgi:hypothetical protein
VAVVFDAFDRACDRRLGSIGGIPYWMLAREPVLARARIGLTSVVVVMVLLLIGALTQRNAFNGPRLSLAAFLGYSIVLGVLSSTSLARMGRGPEGRVDRQPGSSMDA